LDGFENLVAHRVDRNCVSAKSYILMENLATPSHRTSRQFTERQVVNRSGAMAVCLLDSKLTNNDLGSKHAIRDQHNSGSCSHADVFPVHSLSKPRTVVAHAPLHAPVGLSDPAVVSPTTHV
jgi:hypothetical protein